MYADNMEYVRQGSQRNGAATVNMRSHHRQIFEFLNLMDNVGDHNARTPNLNISMWNSWLFWDRVRSNGDWTLFCPADTKQLNLVYGMEFKKRYLEAEADPKLVGKKTVVKAQDLLKHMCKMQQRSGKPYMLNGCSANFKSPHNHVGYLRSSNLCQEIIEYTSPTEINVCNLKSINMAAFAKGRYMVPPRSFTEALQRVNMKKLGQIAWNCVVYLNRVIDNNFYPLDTDDGETKHKGPIHVTNERFRSLGIGISGLAEFFASIDVAYVDDIAGELDKHIFACIYFNTLASSVQCSILEGPHDVFEGSSYSKGKLQFDLWQEEYILRWCPDGTPASSTNPVWKYEDTLPVHPDAWGQETIKLHNSFGDVIDTIAPTYVDLVRCIVKYKLRNSLLGAQMPTASSAKTMRNSESCEPHIANIYSTKLLAGAFPVMNRFMYFDLMDIGLWNHHTREYIIANNGKLTGLCAYINKNSSLFPEPTAQITDRLMFLERKYMTMYEISQKLTYMRAARRGLYLDQSQSTSAFMEEPTEEKLMAMHIMADMLGLKTGMYYLRTRSAIAINKFTVNPNIEKALKDMKEQSEVCRMEEGCIMCGS
jgi:ribonucleoside-diphosphate reductase subunit M1